MKLSAFTLNVLKNFKQVNPQLIIQPGNTLKTTAIAKNIIVAVDVEETFPTEVAIYDLAEFLSTLDLVADPEIHFRDQMAIIKDASGRVNIKYWFADPSNLKFEQVTVGMPPSEVNFTLDNSTLQNVKRAAAVFGHTMLCISGTKNLVTLSVLDKDNVTSNHFSIDVPGTSLSDDFKFYVAIENLKMIPADYQVRASSKRIAQLTSVGLERQVDYWIALEKSSVYNA